MKAIASFGYVMKIVESLTKADGFQWQNLYFKVLDVNYLSVET